MYAKGIEEAKAVRCRAAEWSERAWMILFVGIFLFIGTAQYARAQDAMPATSTAETPPTGAPGPGVETERSDPPVEWTDFGYLPTWTEGGLGSADTPERVASVLKTVALLTFLTLAPGMLVLITCFTRIIIVLSFLRRALATQTLPPDQVLVGLALFLTIFIMAPTWERAWETGLKPYLDGSLDPMTGEPMGQREAFERMLEPQRSFMLACLSANDGLEEVEFFMGVSGHRERVDGVQYWIGDGGRRVEKTEDLRPADIPTIVLIPAFITSELKRGFWMGFLLYLPFLIVDIVIASVLMSMGMMMLPPVMISLPFKIVLFVIVDGWRLLMEGIVTSFPPDMLEFYTSLI